MPGLQVQQAALNAMGIDWYVRRDVLIDAQPIAQFETAQPQSLIEDSERAIEPPAVQGVSSLMAGLDIAPAIEASAAAAPAKSSKSDTTTEVTAAKVAPFNWLVAECGRMVFVCDIKTPRLNGVWHGAALEMLADIAVAMRQKATIRSKYFNWPVQQAAAPVISDDDFVPFLEGFLDHDHEQPLYVLLGESAQKQAALVVGDQMQLVKGPSLGQLFTDTSKKRELWQSLKPLR